MITIPDNFNLLPTPLPPMLLDMVGLTVETRLLDCTTAVTLPGLTSTPPNKGEDS